jgi:hypothetical protein
MEQVPYQHDYASDQPAQTSVHRADSHHKRHHVDDMQDRLPHLRLKSQHARCAGSNPNRRVSVYKDVMFTYAEDRPAWVDHTSEDTQFARHAHIPVSHGSRYSELPYPHDSVLSLNDNTPDDHTQSVHSHWSTQSISSSCDTCTTLNPTNSTTPLTATTLHLNNLVESQQNISAPPAPPQDFSLDPSQIRHINRYGHVQPDENTFDTQYKSAHEAIPVGQRGQSCARGNRDSMSFINGDQLNDNVAPSLLHQVERPNEGISGHFRQLARRVSGWRGW